jgi:hypothetical protein
LTFESGYMTARSLATAFLKGAISAGPDGLARALSLEQAPMRVNTFSPDLIETLQRSAVSEANRWAILPALPSGSRRRIRQPG